MNNSENIFTVQKRLFEEVQKNLPAKFALVDTISEALNISFDAAYRRIRCDKLLDLKDIYTLCKHFRISFDMLMEGKSINQFDCIYRPISFSTPNEYLSYSLSLSKNFGKLASSNDSKMLMSAIDIPVFHLLSQKELTFFKLYTWFHSVYNYEGSLDDFMKEIDIPEIVSNHQKICNDYELVPSSEIWTERTIDTTLRLINYYVEIDDFPNKKLPFLICEQVLNILGKLQKWAESGNKGDSTIPFQFYLSEIDFECTYVLMKGAGITNCLVKLFTINSFNVLDRDFCNETENYLTKLSQRSIPLCGSAEKERIKFFNSQRQKVRALMEKIQSV